MKHSTNLICLFVIFSVYITCVTVAQNYLTSENKDPNGANEESDEDDLNDLIPTIRAAQSTLCETPNHEFAECIPIKKCDILLRQVTNEKAVQFLQASQCGSTEDINNPKVCCGKHNNFKNISNESVKKVKAFSSFCGRQMVSMNSRIKGGSEAMPGEYPWMARLIYENNFGVQSDGCSGFLVHSKFIITAAHCTHPYHTKIKGPVKFVILGGHNTTSEKGCFSDGKSCPKSIQVREVIKVINHPEYNLTNKIPTSDIAIIRITKAHRSDFVQLICLPRYDTQIPYKYYLSGWGTTENEYKSEVKLKVEIGAFDHVECRNKYSTKNINIIDTQICAGGERKKDSCSGDSGGPLMMTSDDGTWIASGIVSFGIGCGIEGWPGVYTKIAKFLPWIKLQMMDNMRTVKKYGKRIVTEANTAHKM